jgi:hypothetical protein
MWPLLFMTLTFGAPDVWVAPSHAHVHRIPETAERSRVAHLYAARGEREAVQVVFTADGDPLEGLRARIVRNDEGVPEPARFQVGLRPVSEPSGRAVGQAPAWPDMLLPDAPRDLDAGDTAVWWVRYDIPRDAEPGVYWHELVFEADNRRRLPDVEIRVEVFDVTLPAAPDLPSLLPVDLAAVSQACGIPGSGLNAWRGVYGPLAAYPLGFGWSWLQNREPEPVPDAPPLKPIPEPQDDVGEIEGEAALVLVPAEGNVETEGEGAPALIPVEGLQETEGEGQAVLIPAEAPANAGPPVPPDGRGPLGHWDYLAQAAPAARFDWTGVIGYGSGRRFQRAWLDTGLPDDVRALLQAAREADLLSRSHVVLEPAGAQVSFADLALLSDLLVRTRAGVPRLFAGPPTPLYQRTVDQYAFPVTDYRPGLTDDLRTGNPLTAPKAVAATEISASSSGWRGDGPWVATRPEDVYDGSIASEWHSETAPGNDAPAWIELQFPEIVELKNLTCHWALGRQPREVTLETSFDGEVFTSATVRWEERPPAPPFSGGVWEGTLRYTNTLRALRLVFRHTAHDRPVGLAELVLGEEAPDAAPRLEPVVQPWLLVGGREYPALTVDAHAVEARLVAWLAWTFGYQGVYIPGVNHWPAPDVPVTGAATAGFLLYPGPGELAPSLRLERLRDGFEDYALLTRYAAAFDTPPEPLIALRGRLERGLATAVDPDELDAVAENIVASRIAMGRALTEAAEAGED